MINRLIDYAIRRHWLMITAGLALAAWGIYAALATPIDAIPDLSENQVLVWADWPGRTPREVDDQITRPLATTLRGVPGIRIVRSSSEVGYVWLSLILDDSADPTPVRRRVSEVLAHASAALPQGVIPRLAPDTPATGQILWYTVEGGGLDLGRLRTIQDTFIRLELSAVPGVAEVASVGGFIPEIHVGLDPLRLRAHDVDPQAVVDAVRQSSANVSAGVVHMSNAEFLVRGAAPLGGAGDDEARSAQAIENLRQVPVPSLAGAVVPLARLASVTLGPGPRRGAFEKDGSEVVGGVVSLTRGENPRAVTRLLKDRIRELRKSLPQGVDIQIVYDRTPLIEGAIKTVSGTVVEAMISATICVVLVLLHLRTSFIIAITLPLSALAAFALIWLMRVLGLTNVPTNAMSLAGIAVSIGVLVDSSIVMSENVLHQLHRRYGNRPVRFADIETIRSACHTVGRPIIFSILIMLLSFLPVFALGGMEGKMFWPLALTKTLALGAAAVLSITLVPALCVVLIRGRLRGEMDSPIVRGVAEVYRPILHHLIDRPLALVLILAFTAILATGTVGIRPLFFAVLGLALVASLPLCKTLLARALTFAALTSFALLVDLRVKPLERQFLTPLDEGMVMDMPITIPRASISQSVDDMKARNMILCRFPEVAMVTGKAGRAETPSDPAPLDMIETMVEFRPFDHWPRRKLDRSDAARQTRRILEALSARGIIPPVAPGNDADAVVDQVVAAVMPRFDSLMREYAYQSNRAQLTDLARSPAQIALDGPDAAYREAWDRHVARLDRALIPRAAETWTRLALEEIISLRGSTDPELASAIEQMRAARLRSDESTGTAHHHQPSSAPGEHSASRIASLPQGITARPDLIALQEELSAPFARSLILWRKSRDELVGFGGELDVAVSMPGWSNVWTMPIQNRVDMLATGVNTMVGVRVLGPDLDTVVRLSEQVAEAVRRVPGAADVVADPVRGKGYLDISLDRARASEVGVSAQQFGQALQLAVGGEIAAHASTGRGSLPVRVRYDRDFRQDEDALLNSLVTATLPGAASPTLIPLHRIARLQSVEGPAVIKGENGQLRNYVRLNVRGRGVSSFVDEARAVVAQNVYLPPGYSLEWTGQFEHEVRTRQTLAWIVPVVLLIILLVLYATYHDWVDAFLILLAVPGAIMGGLICQWILGEPFSVTVWVGYIACAGMATSTGIIMLVYLREAIQRHGGLAAMTPQTLREAVLEGAVQRLRPKLLTEGTILLGLVPMLWAGGVASEVIRPMAAPVLGGILIADEVIDLLLPVIFYRVRRRRWNQIHRSHGPVGGAFEMPARERSDASVLASATTAIQAKVPASPPEATAPLLARLEPGCDRDNSAPSSSS
jgi:Cu(I)/Ag(I) efflux system membrane protein CusA/SilA